jgi:polygalacturonase
MRKLFFLSFLAVPLFCTDAAPKLPFNVRDFGASGDGANKDTVAFQKALDACAISGGGEVVVPAGKYVIGSVQMGDRTILRLEKDSVITGSPDTNDYPMMDSPNPVAEMLADEPVAVRSGTRPLVGFAAYQK